MRVLVTGASNGIGRATADYFLQRGHKVVGLDVLPSDLDKYLNYTHCIGDVTKPETFPEDDFDIIINNAGVQQSGSDIDINLRGVVNITEFYLKRCCLTSVVMVGSVSGHTGAEFPEYVAAKGGLVAYTKNVANRLAPHGTCNSIDPGGVLTDLNKPVMEDAELWQQIMDVTPLKRWATPYEIARWIYFVGVEQSFMTGQAIIIDGGESCRSTFVWPEQ